MADSSSNSASVRAVATAAIVSIRSLSDTIKGFKGRNNTLQRLQTKLHEIVAVLEALVQVKNADTSISGPLECPIERCKERCNEFERSMKKYYGKSNTGLLDWTKLEFMRGDINDFIETIEGYRSTITVGLGRINLRDSNVSRDVLQQYEEMVKDTAYNLEVHLQRLDEKLKRYNNPHADISNTIVDLQDERVVTQQCLRICKEASSYVGSLSIRESAVLQNPSQLNPGAGDRDFEAQVLTRQTLTTSQTTLLGVINRLGERLHSVIMEDGVGKENERKRLQQDIDVAKQCLHLCKLAGEISQQKIYRIGEVVAEEDSDQIVVTTLADLFEVKRTMSKGRSAQLVATLTPENLDRVVEKRYSNRYGV